MNVQGVVDQAGRWIEGAQRKALNLLDHNADTDEPCVGELWKRVSPQFEKALAIYDRRESESTPESSWIPFRETRKSCQQDMEDILDTVLAVLGTCGANGYRHRIRNLQRDNADTSARIARYREQILSAPEETTQNFVEALMVQSKEALTDCISDENERINERNRQIAGLKVGFVDHLKQIGVILSPENVDSFLLPVVDDVISMAALISNIGLITEQLQQLVDANKEAPAETRRYYGMHLLMVFAVDRLQNHFLSEIDQQYLPRIGKYKEDAFRHIAAAKGQIKNGGPRDLLAANIAGNTRTIEACELLAARLCDYRRAIQDENRKVLILEAAAVNTYRTVSLSLNVAELFGYCESAFHALRALRLPPLRPFQSIQLTEELQKLAQCVAAKE